MQTEIKKLESNPKGLIQAQLLHAYNKCVKQVAKNHGLPTIKDDRGVLAIVQPERKDNA